MQVPIIGIGAAHATYAEYLSVNVLQAFTADIAPLKQIFLKDGSLITPADYDSILAQIQQLAELAQNGRTDTNGQTTFQSYMNQAMVDTLNGIMRTFALVGIPPSSGSPSLSDAQKIATVQAWQNLSLFGVDVNQALNDALSLLPNSIQYQVSVTQPGTGIPQTLTVEAHPTRTLLSMVQIEYLSIGNQIIGENLGQLQQALSTTQAVLNSLTTAQNILNQIQVINPQPPFTFPPVSGSIVNQQALLALAKSNESFRQGLVGGQTTFSPLTALSFPSSTNFFAQEINRLLQQGTPQQQSDVSSILNSLLNFGGVVPPANNAQVLFLAQRELVKQQPTLAAAMIQDYQAFTGTTPAQLIASIANGSSNSFRDIYKPMASAYFTQIIPSAVPTATAASDLLQVKQQLYQELLQLEAQSPTNTRNTSGTLANAVYVVIQDISAAFSGISTVNNPQLQSQLLSAVKKWILDGQDTVINSSGSQGNANKIGGHLTTAITSGQNLEETQRDAVTRAMFLFNEFYKTAYAIVSLIGKMITSINKSANK